MVFNKKIVGRFYPRQSKFLQALNQNALFIKWAKKHEACAALASEGETVGLPGFYRYIHQLVAGNDKPIDYLEFGVAEGGTLRLWLEINEHRNSRFYGFDSFYGLPEDWVWARGGMPKGTYSTNGKVPDIADKRVQCIKGLFQESLPVFLKRYEPRNRLIVNLDCDLYSSTLFCLTQLDSILEEQLVLFDEFDNLLHEFAAFQDYACSYRRTYRVLARLGYFKKVAIQIAGRY
jgi:hypothetical protein